MFTNGESGVVLSWTQNRHYLLIRRNNPKTGADLVAVAANGQPSPIVVAQSPHEETEGQFSPNGKWVALVANDSGRPEVFLQSFPGATNRTQVSTAGGTQVRWSHDGNEIFYIAPDGRMTAVSVALDGASPVVKPPVALFQTRSRDRHQRPRQQAAVRGRARRAVPPQHRDRESQRADRRRGELDEETLSDRRSRDGRLFL